MSTIRPLIAALSACILTACGGGGGTDSTAPDTAPAEIAPSVLMLGDSTLTRYWPGAQSTPDHLQALTGWTVTNAAVSGQDACQAPLQQIRSTTALVVAANYGLLDAYGDAGKPRHTPDQYRICLERIAAAAKDAGAVLVWIQATPTLPSPGWDTQQIAPYDALKRQVGPAYYCEAPKISWTSAELPDGQHLSTPAMIASAAQIAACIKSALAD